MVAKKIFLISTHRAVTPYHQQLFHWSSSLSFVLIHQNYSNNFEVAGWCVSVKRSFCPFTDKKIRISPYSSNVRQIM
jgi:hypothetical protein